MLQTQMIQSIVEKAEELDALCNERLANRRLFERQQAERDIIINRLSSHILQLYTKYNAHPVTDNKTTNPHRLPDAFLIDNLLVEIDKEGGSVHVVRYLSLSVQEENH